ncbi:Nucleoporin NDC1 [Bagarius yarrelli]|uniref:Nucleoporin NDC1 n=1 Tax=Bagarius yarrelli TaxID=175774 RepID=A0A556VBS5_BAGYA|nr:Nucleoporin NDC1 [Bagarius yarrelli]
MARKASVEDTQKLVDRYLSERDEARKRENVLKEKPRQYESRTKSTESLKQKFKTLTIENKDLRRQGKPTRDIIELHEKERERDTLLGKTESLKLELSTKLARTVTSKTLLEEKQYKYMRFKGSLWWLVKCSAVQSLYFVRNYVILYFLFGHIPRTWISSALKLHADSSVGSLDSFGGLCDVSLFYQLWISGMFLFFTWYLTVLLFRIYVTEPYRFPVQSSFAEDAEECLPKVLTERNILIMKFLALQDLALLSQHSPSRRQEVFSLSQPGGHPHNWNAISKECVSLLSDLTQRLIDHHDTVAANGRAKPPSERSDRSSSSSCSGTEDLPDTPRRSVPTRTPGSVFGSAVRGVNTPLTAPFTPELTTPFSSPNPFSSPALRPLLGSQVAQRPWLGSVQSPHVTRRNPKLWSTSSGCLFGLPEASSQALFADSQAHIWALEGLSYLVAASYSEDKYGVVQTTLPNILGCMLSLQEAVDRHFKLPHASSKPGKTSYSLGDSAYKSLRFALRATLKTAIYRITSTFGKHLQ